MASLSFRQVLTGLGLALALGAATAPHDAGATTLVKLSTEQLTDVAEFIVIGTVVDVWTEVDDGGMVWTRALVEIDDQLKGPSHSTLVLDQAGGEYGSSKTYVAGVARFSVGERGVFFASTRGDERIQLVGMFQGKYTVRMDPYSRQEIVQRFTLPLGRTYDHRFIPLPPEEDRVALDDLVDRVSDRLDLGWDGQPIPGVSPDKLLQRNKLQPGVK